MNQNDMKTLSDIQNSSSRIVLAGGVFDIIHPGHIQYIECCKKTRRCFSCGCSNR